MNDIMIRLQGVVTKMDNGFDKAQVSLESLSTQVTDLSNSVEFAHQIIKDVKQDLQKERSDKKLLLARLEKMEGENLLDMHCL